MGSFEFVIMPNQSHTLFFDSSGAVEYEIMTTFEKWNRSYEKKVDEGDFMMDTCE